MKTLLFKPLPGRDKIYKPMWTTLFLLILIIAILADQDDEGGSGGKRMTT